MEFKSFSTEYKRQEGFRFTFDPPLDANFKIIKIGDKTIETAPGAVKILDISPGGLRIRTMLDIPMDKEIELSIIVPLNEPPFNLTGTIVWKNQHDYGLRLTINEARQKWLIEELKYYARTHKQRKR